MTTAHTPGPWVARKDTDSMFGDDWMIGRPVGKPDEIAVCSARDAHLIAAAPDLLAFAQWIARRAHDLSAEGKRARELIAMAGA